MAVMIVTFVGFIYFERADLGWLIGMLVAIIGVGASMYRDARRNVRSCWLLRYFWSRTLSQSALHSMSGGRCQ
jgi:hypothetical protein